MKLDPAKLELYAITGAVVLVALFILVKGWRGAARSTVDAAGNVVGGVVVGIGDQVGLPDPATPESQDRCAAAMAAGRTLDASLYCPAGTFLKYLAAPKPSTAPAINENVITPGWID